MNVTRSLLVVGFLATCGCSDELTRIEHTLHEQADTLGARLAGWMVRGARDTLTSRATERLLAELVDSPGRGGRPPGGESRHPTRRTET
jgi:hypothetical protein